MKKKISIWYVITAVAVFFLAAVMIGPILWWNMKTETPLTVWILDKTVPDETYREHIGLTWILNHDRITNQYDLEPFQADSDYYGFFPEGGSTYTTKGMPSNYENPNLIYLADSYGVYSEDGYLQENTDTQSSLLYGGINKEDIFSIKNNIGNGNTLIGEFNVAADPTTVDNRKELESLFGIEWTGWRGTYFRNLARGIEVPEGIIAQYEAYTQKTWNFSEGGYVLISDEGKIAVLQEEIHIKKNGLEVEFNGEYQKEFNIKKAIAYHYWFEFTTPKLGREVIADYKMNLTEEGQKLMEELGLPTDFPAITRYENNLYTSYYFSGDFAEMSNDTALVKYAGIEGIKKFTSSFNKSSMNYFYWNCYVPVMNKILGDIKEKASITQFSEVMHPDEVLIKAEDSGFQILNGTSWDDIFIKGVNIGAAEPGKWFTEFPTDEETYYNWFVQIGEMNANTIRVYTLLPPQFYTALKYYNETHPENILYLFQEIWPEENPEDLNYLKEAYIKQYNKEIECVIDAVHGRAKIDERVGRAYGIYTADVSDYIIGYLVGRELEPDEVIATNELNSSFSYQGEYISSGEGASATEAWLAMNCDYVVQYEAAIYGCQHPTAIVSWPTLDIAEHDSEWNAEGLKSNEYNDKVSIDINHIDTSENLLAGFFGAYHIYPNYPDFMNDESKYAGYSDEEGEFRYGGYLQEFMQTHTKYPALVAEFGLATGMGNAHTNPNGYNHGGLTEDEQGNGIIRMFKAIRNENYAGGLIFEWMDEWAKKTWITEPYMIPYDRHVYWHNAIDPEQNYGILAMESLQPEESDYTITGTGEIGTVSLRQDETYLYIDVTLKDALDFNAEELYIGLDTDNRDSGEFCFSPELTTKAPFGMEFLLDFTGEQSSRLLVQPGYNIFNGNYASYYSTAGIFEEMLQLINNENTGKDGTVTKAIYQNCSVLRYGALEGNSYYHWTITDHTVSVRLPWNRLNFSDPSQMKVLHDGNTVLNPIRDQISTVTSDGIMISVHLVDKTTKETLNILSSETPYQWEPWTNPNTTSRLKNSYTLLQKYFGEID